MVSFVLQKKYSMMNEKDNPFKLTAKERLIELMGIVIFLLIFIGSAAKLLFL